MTKGFFISIVLSGLLVAGLYSPRAIAQEQPSIYQQADAYFQRSDFAKAAGLYEMAIRKQKNRGDTMIMRRLAYSYLNTGHYQQSANWYAQLVQQPGIAPENWLHYGDMLQSLGKYDSARIAYKQYATLAGNSPRINARIAGCDSAIIWSQPSQDVRIENVRILNSTQPDWGLVWYQKGQVVFVSDSVREGVLHPGTKVNKRLDGRTKYDYSKLYSAQSRGPEYGYVDGFSGTINKYLYHIGPACFSANYDTAFVTMTNPDKKINLSKITKEVYGRRRLGLYIFVRKGSQWHQLEEFAYNNLDSFSVGHAALGNNGSILYFTSDRPGGVGGTDIWYCTKQSETSWSAPVNCGATINTPEDEGFPSVATDGTLYFSSKGLPGLGGYDVFRSNGSMSAWSTPVNMRAPFNSSADDFCFIVNDQGDGFLSSNRPGGKGEDDIYRFIANKTTITATTTPSAAVLMLEMTVLDYNSKAPVPGADALLKEPSKKRQWTERVPDNGKIYNAVDAGEAYTAEAFTPNCPGQPTPINTNNVQGDTIRVTLYTCGNYTPATTATPTPSSSDALAVENIYYDLNKSNIRKDAAVIMDKLTAILKSHPGATVILSSYTDARGSGGYNEALSARRAAAAKAYLEHKGVSGKRIRTDHFGKKDLVNNCGDGKPCPEAEHQQNRRTMITIKP